MATAKTTALTFPIELGRKETLRPAAYREHGSVANRVEALIRDYCRRNSVTISKQGALFDGGQKPATRGK